MLALRGVLLPTSEVDLSEGGALLHCFPEQATVAEHFEHLYIGYLFQTQSCSPKNSQIKAGA